MKLKKAVKSQSDTIIIDNFQGGTEPSLQYGSRVILLYTSDDVREPPCLMDEDCIIMQDSQVSGPVRYT